MSENHYLEKPCKGGLDGWGSLNTCQKYCSYLGRTMQVSSDDISDPKISSISPGIVVTYPCSITARTTNYLNIYKSKNKLWFPYMLTSYQKYILPFHIHVHVMCNCWHVIHHSLHKFIKNIHLLSALLLNIRRLKDTVNVLTVVSVRSINSRLQDPAASPFFKVLQPQGVGAIGNLK